MFPLFRKKKKEDIQLEGLTNTIDSAELVDSPQQGDQDSEVKTELSIHPLWNVSKEQYYVFRFLNNELPTLKPNQLSLSGIQWEETSEGLSVTAFIRNSLKKPIQLEEVPLILLDENREVVAKHTFNLHDAGEIPAESSRPWTFVFPKESLLKDHLQKEGWTLAFDLSTKQHQLDLEPSWEQSLPDEEKKKLQQLVSQLEPPKKNELNFMGLEAKMLQSGDLAVTLLIRNGYEKAIQIQQLPLRIIDANDAIAAEGQFNIGQLEIKPNTTKPWTFIFPKNNIKKSAPDLSSWKAVVIQKQD
ncbi:accessory Sec system S-layer assembly protein [Bacillus smithii]|uniref:accessory Sec system S-layer assembly protein n=1 Tax=Bacillus smithii TaxID=1479 RepID=UPI002E1EAFCB|nr:accessory Sec system S-layer assembly protein [Bacillus smithii]